MLETWTLPPSEAALDCCSLEQPNITKTNMQEISFIPNCTINRSTDVKAKLRAAISQDSNTYFWCLILGLISIWTKHELSRRLTRSRIWWLRILGSIVSFWLVLLKSGRRIWCNWLCQGFSVQTSPRTSEWAELGYLVGWLIFNWIAKNKFKVRGQ